ncbi:MAG: response regulator [Candidatus Schekmanbacteria bacterium]|nr:response regulator [Candidatus Schekmanbacteria bacterium]
MTSRGVSAAQADNDGRGRASPQVESAELICHLLTELSARGIRPGLCAVVTAICEAFGFSGGWVVYRLPTGESETVRAVYRLPTPLDEHGEEFFAAYGPCTGCLGGREQTGKAVAVVQCHRVARYSPDNRVVSTLLRAGDKTIGVMDFLLPATCDLSAETLRFLGRLGGLAAASVAHAQAAEALEVLNVTLERRVYERTIELKTIAELTEEVARVGDFEALAELIARKVRRAVSPSVAACLLAVERHEVFCIDPAGGVPAGTADQARAALATGLARLHRDAGAGARKEPPALLQLDLGTGEIGSLAPRPALVAAPLLAEGLPVGVLAMSRCDGTEFSEDQLSVFHAMSNVAEHAVERIQRLRLAEQRRFERIFRYMPEGMVLLSAAGRLEVANPLGRSYLDVLAGAPAIGNIVAKLGDTDLATLLADGKERTTHEVRTVTAPLRRFEIEVGAMGDTGDAEHWIVLLRDVTEERELLSKVQERDRLAAVGQLAAGIAHDFNNLLSVIIGNASLLAATADASPDLRSGLERIVKTGGVGADLVRQILDFSRKSFRRPVPLDLGGVIDSSAQRLAQLLPDRIELTTRIAGGGPHRISGDEAQIRQALANLARNAQEAMPDGGVLAISLDRFELAEDEAPPCVDMAPGTWIRLVFADTGRGIPPQHIDHIFEPFFTTKPARPASGLGLAQVYGIVKQHGGAIQVDSRVTIGTRLTIFFPALHADESAPAPSTARAATAPNDTVQKRILLVEDDDDVRETLQMMLRVLGYEVATAGNGGEALASFGAGPRVHAVVTDLVMPVMDGITLAESLRIRAPDLPIIVMTGYQHSREIDRLLRNLGVRSIFKPIAAGDLAGELAAVLGQASSLRGAQ